MTTPAEQQTNKEKRIANIAPYQFKKGQSGNPAGRPAGKTLKEYAKELLAGMSEEERQEYLQGIDKKTIWEMAEGKAQADVTSGGQPIALSIINYGDNDTPQLPT